MIYVNTIILLMTLLLVRTNNQVSQDTLIRKDSVTTYCQELRVVQTQMNNELKQQIIHLKLKLTEKKENPIKNNPIKNKPNE